MLRYSVYVPGSEVCPFFSYFPVFPSEVEVGVFSPYPKHMGYAHGISSRAIEKEPGPYHLAAILRPNLQEIFGYFNRLDLETENELHAFSFRVSSQRACERGIVNRGVRLRPYSPVRLYVRFKLPHIFRC